MCSFLTLSNKIFSLIRSHKPRCLTNSTTQNAVSYRKEYTGYSVKVKKNIYKKPYKFSLLNLNLFQVEYWFRKLIDNSDRNLVPRRRRQYKMLVDDDLCVRFYFLIIYFTLLYYNCLLFYIIIKLARSVFNIIFKFITTTHVTFLKLL